MNHAQGLRIFSKLTCFATLFLIFAGGMVTSTGSGLAVPDWPLSYGMLFPPMVGGVFYEHGHRMVASTVGLMMLILTVWIALKDPRRWVKVLAFFGLGAVIVQGVLGGITVLFFLPTPVSVAHGVLAQTFFLMTIFIAYSQSRERAGIAPEFTGGEPILVKWSLVLLLTVYVQLILGAVMRHTESGLAIYDFPTMAGEWVPTFNEAILSRINLWRFDNGFDLVTLNQVIYHFLHRIGALIVIIVAVALNIVCIKSRTKNTKIIRTVIAIDILLLTQVTLGILTIFTLKAPVITSFHVVTGAATLGLVFLLLLRSAPVKYEAFCRCLKCHEQKKPLTLTSS